jgi:hypothetical protein
MTGGKAESKKGTNQISGRRKNERNERRKSKDRCKND